MSGEALRGIARHVREKAGPSPLADSELLRRFAEGRDEMAFATLVSRHGPLVWSAVRASLRHQQDAEDAYQATFLVLARRPLAVPAGAALAAWLLGVARRVALKARTAAARRAALLQRADPAGSEAPAAKSAALRELQAILYEEVERLPEKYRAPFVLCHLEGRARLDAARELGCKEGTLSARLTRGRRLLEARLARRGVALAAALTATALGGACPSFASEASAGATALAEGVIQAMILSKWKAVGAMLLVLTTLAAGLGLAARSEKPAPAKADEAAKPVAADLVRAARRDQDWVRSAKSLSVRFEGTITDAKGKAIRERVDVGFDGHRLRHTLIREGFDHELHLWDGKRTTTHVKSASGHPDRYIHGRDPLDVGDGMSAGLLWLWGQPHSFWWTRPERDPHRAKLLRDMQGEPGWFVLTGKAVYQGIPCHVLQLKGEQMVRLYVGEKTGRLHGRMEHSLFGNPVADREAVKAAATEGKKVKTFAEFAQWVDSLERDKGNRLMTGVLEKSWPTDHPKLEAWFLDYKEVRPGRWFPMTQGTSGYGGTHAKPVTQYRSEWKAVEAKVDDPLPGSLFSAPAPKDGALVIDNTTDPPLSYTHKKDRTKADWDALRVDARQQRAEERKAQARREELVGKPALPLPKDGWLVGKPRTWQDLRGKPVLLLFWAEWCGPCHGFLPLLAGDGEAVTVIGVHPPGSDRADIEKALKAAKANAAVVLDADDPKKPRGPGALFDGYRLGGLPSAVLVGADGNVVAVGYPDEVMKRLRDLAAKKRE